MHNSNEGGALFSSKLSLDGEYLRLLSCKRNMEKFKFIINVFLQSNRNVIFNIQYILFSGITYTRSNQVCLWELQREAWVKICYWKHGPRRKHTSSESPHLHKRLTDCCDYSSLRSRLCIKWMNQKWPRWLTNSLLSYSLPPSTIIFKTLYSAYDYVHSHTLNLDYTCSQGSPHSLFYFSSQLIDIFYLREKYRE